jgi:hypothetical protein
VLLALDHNVKLVAHVLETTKNLSVSIGEVEDGVRNASVGTELADHNLCLAEVVARHTGEKMVNGLELKTAVNKIHPRGAVDIHSGSELSLSKGFRLAEVNSGHSPVRKGDLDVKRHGDDVRNEDEDDTSSPVGETAPEETVAEEEPVANHEGDLSRSNPPGAALSKLRGLLGQNMEPRKEVKVEARNAHDRVVGVFLEGNKEIGGGVPDKSEVVVARVERLEERGACGEKRDVLNIGIVFLAKLVRD